LSWNGKVGRWGDAAPPHPPRLTSIAKAIRGDIPYDVAHSSAREPNSIRHRASGVSR
jgi:hypothetical protein